jgi:hypothetical protein
MEIQKTYLVKGKLESLLKRAMALDVLNKAVGFDQFTYYIYPVDNIIKITLWKTPKK